MHVPPTHLGQDLGDRTGVAAEPDVRESDEHVGESADVTGVPGAARRSVAHEHDTRGPGGEGAGDTGGDDDRVFEGLVTAQVGQLRQVLAPEALVGLAPDVERDDGLGWLRLRGLPDVQFAAASTLRPVHPTDRVAGTVRPEFAVVGGSALPDPSFVGGDGLGEGAGVDRGERCTRGDDDDLFCGHHRPVDAEQAEGVLDPDRDGSDQRAAAVHRERLDVEHGWRDPGPTSA